MRILVACDSFKESCSAQAVCASIAQGLRRTCDSWEIELCPLADGGEGTVAAIASCHSARLERVSVLGPLGELADADLAWIKRDALPTWFDVMPDAERALSAPVALIEAASCLGLALVPERRRDPLVTTSYGLGQLISHVHRQGASCIIVGLGGTSTVDAGIGMAQALGVSFPGIRAPAGGGALPRVSAIDLAAMVHGRSAIRVLVAADVNNPLLGPRGAARAFGPQKGASAQVVEYLEHGIGQYARRLFEACAHAREAETSGPKPNFDDAVALPGAGAAGGLGFALQQLFSATVTNGVELVMRCVRYEDRLARADIVVTGEGRLDESSFEGKVVSAVVARAASKGIPVYAICGMSTFDAVESARRGITHVETLLEHATDLDDAKTRARELLASAGERIAVRL